MQKVIVSGDWLLVDDPERGMMRGFVEGEPSRYATWIMIRVTEADDKRLVGRSIKVRMQHVTRNITDEIEFHEEGQILNLIDFSLITGDRDEFMRWTEKLRKIRKLEGGCA